MYRICLVFCLSFFLKCRHFVQLHKISFHQIKKQKEIIKYKTENFMILITLSIQIYDLTEPTLSRLFTCCNVIHYLFRKVFCNILIKKFQSCSPRTGCLALYVEQLLVTKILYFFLLVTCCKYPLSRSFLNHRVILWDSTSHIIKHLRTQ